MDREERRGDFRSFPLTTRALSAQRALAPFLWRSVNGIFLIYDACYRLLHRLHPVDDFLFLNVARYRGELRIFADGTVLHDGDTIGVIHFNNRYLARAHAEANEKGGKRAAFVFGYALIESMQSLAHELGNNPSFRELTVITGITWFKPHGNKVGFESEPLPEGGRKRLLKKHFRLLLYALFPQLSKREGARLEPHRFWLTKNRLIESMTAQDNHVARRLSRERRLEPGITAGASPVLRPKQNRQARHPWRSAKPQFSKTGAFEK